MTTSELQSTTDYTKFNLLDYNRDIDVSLLNKLKTSMGKRGFLPFCPVVVDGAWNIIDGQHRFLAAKELQLPVWYLMTDNEDKSVIVTMNADKKAWSLADYCKMYAVQGNKYYTALRNFAERHNIRVGMAFALITGQEVTNTKALSKLFKEGGWVCTEEELELAAKDYKNIMTITDMVSFSTTVRLITAILKMSRSNSFSWDRMLENCRRYRDKLYACTSHSSWLRMFEDVYNYRERIKVSFSS